MCDFVPKWIGDDLWPSARLFYHDVAVPVPAIGVSELSP
jgi:hypothetical protein